ncbi:uncharacterized protein LOC121388481 [Gigantopelta aegis]|uniref:uncharacterized protein LOC121388481 n=1 Tax=Gigantopelta aegis TaxID=1735272 RepID=UPI001B88E696|nr:uncharacterized protein LOC121388481 [Gigantopelta aegis]
MKFLLVAVAVLYVCYGTPTTTTTTTTPDPSLKQVDPAINQVSDKSELYDGIDLSTLTNQELEQLANAEDEIFVGELDVWGLKRSLVHKSQRRKRWIGLAFRAALTVGRTIMRGAARRGVTRSGSRLTRHYQKPGSYRSALRDFSRMKTQGTKPITGNNGLRGYTGRMGNHRVTVRNRSSNGSPTLEIRSPKAGGGTTVRKFRYNKN